MNYVFQPEFLLELRQKYHAYEPRFENQSKELELDFGDGPITEGVIEYAGYLPDTLEKVTETSMSQLRSIWSECYDLLIEIYGQRAMETIYEKVGRLTMDDYELGILTRQAPLMRVYQNVDFRKEPNPAFHFTNASNYADVIAEIHGGYVNQGIVLVRDVTAFYVTEYEVMIRPNSFRKEKVYQPKNVVAVMTQ